MPMTGRWEADDHWEALCPDCTAATGNSPCDLLEAVNHSGRYLCRQCSLPLHVVHEERLVRGRLPGEALARAVDRDVLVEADARQVLLQDLQRLAVLREALLLVERRAR